MIAATTRPYTPRKAARSLGVGVHKVLSWIATGELRAFNVAGKASKRPQWKIDEAEIEDFKLRIGNLPASNRILRRGRNTKPEPDFIEYF